VKTGPRGPELIFNGVAVHVHSLPNKCSRVVASKEHTGLGSAKNEWGHHLTSEKWQVHRKKIQADFSREI